LKLLPGRDRLPDAMHAPSSFAESELARRRSGLLRRRGKYDARSMSFRAPEPGFAGPPPKQGRRRSSRLVAVIALLAAMALLGAIVVVVMASLAGNDVKAGQKVVVTIPKDATGGDIAQILADKHVVKSRISFAARLRLSGKGSEFKPGTYRMKTGSSYDTVVRVLEQGPPPAPTFRIAFPEGFRITQMAQRVGSLHDETAAQGLPLPRFVAGDYAAAVKRAVLPAGFQKPGVKTVEGFLFPATYTLKRTATADDLVRQQLAAFTENTKGVDFSYAKSKHLTPYEVITIASMVEREARVPSERPLIAAVIYNRLHERMTLGIDATVQYVADPNVWKTDLRESDLAIDSPYNTRLKAGLPPTPIANPGLSSIQAAAHPAKTDALYYVAKGDGSGKHYFTKSYDDFLAHQ
jgi:UPF0755 protein